MATRKNTDTPTGPLVEQDQLLDGTAIFVIREDGVTKFTHLSQARCEKRLANMLAARDELVLA